MKTLLVIFSLFTFHFCLYSQVTLDSSEVSRLIIKLNEREYLLQKDSLSTLELAKKDTVISLQENQISNLERQVFNSDAIISNLNKQIALTQESGLRWYHYAGGGVLCTIIGILTGLLIK